MKQQFAFNRQFLRELWQFILPFWQSREKYRAYFYLGMNVLCAIASVKFSIALNDLNREFYDALQQFNSQALFSALQHFLIIMAGLALSFGYAYYFSSLLALRWRAFLTSHYLQTWINKQPFYHAHLFANGIDNPDQRISDDLNRFPYLSLTLLFLLFQGALIITSFGYILWQSSACLPISFQEYRFCLPGYLTWSAILYALFGTWVTAKLSKKLIHLNYWEQVFGANFRFQLIKIREASSVLASINTPNKITASCDAAFAPIYTNNLQTIYLRKQLKLFTSGYNTSTYILGLALAIPLYLKRLLPLGGVMQISGAFSSVIGAFCSLINAYDMICEWRAVTARLLEFKISLITKTSSQIKTSSEKDLHFMHLQHMHIALPNGESLFTNLNLSLPLGQLSFINGPTGSGKTTLLRTLCGIWPYAQGTIIQPKNQRILLLTATPFLTVGTLQECLIFPLQTTPNHHELLNLLELCHLGNLRARLTTHADWSKNLSSGEQQLIALLQALLLKPELLCLDEATNALDETLEKEMYSLLQLKLPGTTIISTSSRKLLQRSSNHVIDILELKNKLLINVA